MAVAKPNVAGSSLLCMHVFCEKGFRDRECPPASCHWVTVARTAPPNGTDVNMMGVDRLLQSMTGGGDRAESFQPYYTRIMTYAAYPFKIQPSLLY